jgi:hypothetical protein
MIITALIEAQWDHYKSNGWSDLCVRCEQTWKSEGFQHMLWARKEEVPPNVPFWDLEEMFHGQCDFCRVISRLLSPKKASLVVETDKDKGVFVPMCLFRPAGVKDRIALMCCVWNKRPKNGMDSQGIFPVYFTRCDQEEILSPRMTETKVLHR